MNFQSDVFYFYEDDHYFIRQNHKNMQMKKIQILLLLSFILFLFSCASTKKGTSPEFSSAPLFGMVYDRENQPCADAQIIIDGKKGPSTDINGRFVIQSLSRGKHDINVTKESYEDISLKFNFLNKSQILYIRMISFDQLLKEIEKAIENKKWEEGATLFERAERIKEQDPVAEYLKAIYFKEKGEIERAEDILLFIIDRGLKLPHVYLSLGDLYQYHMNDPEKALQYLTEFLKLESNHEVQKRYNQLRDDLQKNTHS